MPDFDRLHELSREDDPKRAAAPELYEALELALQVIESLAQHQDTCAFYEEFPVDFAECECGLFDAEQLIRAALAKARGDAPQQLDAPEKTNATG